MPWTFRVVLALPFACLATPLLAQTGRALAVLEPPQVGATARFEVAYPAAAVGNFGWFLVSGHEPLTTPLVVPGFTSYGLLRIAPSQLLGTEPWSPVAGASAAEMALAIPAVGSLAGFRFDVQAMDLDLTSSSIYFSDNDLELAVVPTGCGAAVSIGALYPVGTALEPDVVLDTATARTTLLADRARDRHAREAAFQQYDHWLPFYWEQRIAELEIIDRVAMGGASITFRWMTHDMLNPAEFRVFYSGVPTVAVYHLNLSDPPGTGVTLVSTSPSTRYPGETEYHYESTITQKFPEQRPLLVGDRIEVELSQFLAAPRNGRLNYYGTAFLYVVGEGVVPWYAKLREEAPTPQQQQAASFDSYRLPDVSWLGGATTLPYQYSDEPEHRFKQMAGNLSPTSGHEFVLGRRLHHTDFDTGEHSEPGNPPLAAHAGQVGPKFVARSCVSCHPGNGRSLPPAVGDPLTQSVVRVAADASGAPHPTLGETLQPSLPLAPGGAVDVTIEAESFVAMSGVLLEATTDIGGGQNITSIDTGDWLSYANQPVVLPTTGLYRVELRVASLAGGGLLAFEESGGAIIHGTVTVPSTGGWQSWQTISADMSMTAGSHVFGINANVGGWNLNWFRVTSLPGGGGTGPAVGEGLARLDGYDLIPGTYGDGATFELRRPRYVMEGAAPQFFSVRNAPPLVGAGLLEAIDEAAIVALQDPCDADQDGISGRISQVFALGTTDKKLGRFGWKAGRASVRDQVAFALNRDMGVATAVMPVLDGDVAATAPEVSALELDRMARYAALLGVGARRDLIDPQALQGELLFASAGCASCHVPELTTGAGHPFGELREQTIRPFTDLLLHDMGPGLADNMADGDAGAAEWRTPPLWSLGLSAAVSGGEAYLHDGRARTIAEAILWHGGEGEAAKEAFRTMVAADRAALVVFLQSL
jgi:CxxC motif-containing protein (DUF1111 family)